jgi:hypothetical protein
MAESIKVVLRFRGNEEVIFKHKDHNHNLISNLELRFLITRDGRMENRQRWKDYLYPTIQCFNKELGKVKLR